MVILVLDTSRSMQAKDVKPTRLAAAQEALRHFLDSAPKKLRVGLVVFAGDAQVATPPTNDHELVEQAVNEIGRFQTFGGTAIGDALAAAVELIRETLAEGQQTIALRTAPAEETKGLASVLFLSDGAQTRGILAPFEGADQAKEAGVLVYTVALGTPEGTVTGGFGFGQAAGPRSAELRRRAGDPGAARPGDAARHRRDDRGEFTEARTADALEKTREKLGSSLGREPGESEVTFIFLAVAGGLLLAAACCRRSGRPASPSKQSLYKPRWGQTP